MVTGKRTKGSWEKVVTVTGNVVGNVLMVIGKVAGNVLTVAENSDSDPRDKSTKTYGTRSNPLWYQLVNFRRKMR